MRFKGKVAIITGSGRGIGREIAQRLAEEGASIMISDIDPDTARETAKEIETSFKTKVSSIQTDVKKREDIYELMECTMRDFGQIDILFNNAGIMYPTPVGDISEEEWDEVLDVNLRGVFFCCQAVTPIMKKRRQGRDPQYSIISRKGRWNCSGSPLLSLQSRGHLSHKNFREGISPLRGNGKWHRTRAGRYGYGPPFFPPGEGRFNTEVSTGEVCRY